MTKYLDKSFSVFPGSNKNYRDNYDQIFKKDKKDGLKKLTEMSEEAGGYPELDLEPQPIPEAPPELLEKSGKLKRQPKTDVKKPKLFKKKKSRGKR